MNPPQVYTCSPSWTPPPTSLPVPSLGVVSVHQPQASSIMHWTWTGDSFHIWYHICNLFSKRNSESTTAQLQILYYPHYLIEKILASQFSWRRKWQPTPVFLPGESHGKRSLVGYSPWGCKESKTTERLTHTQFSKCDYSSHGTLLNPSIFSCIPIWVKLCWYSLTIHSLNALDSF